MTMFKSSKKRNLENSDEAGEHSRNTSMTEVDQTSDGEGENPSEGDGESNAGAFSEVITIATKKKKKLRRTTTVKATAELAASLEVPPTFFISKTDEEDTVADHWNAIKTIVARENTVL